MFIFFLNQPVIMPTDQNIYNTQHLFPCHQFYFITLLTIAKEIRFLRATPNYSNLVVVPFEYFTNNPEVTGFSHALTDKKSNVALELGLLSCLVCKRLTELIGM